MPQSWIEKRSQLDPETRFNFVATTDVTGGNSGSPVVDKDGMLVGLAFDGNIHSIAGSFWFDESKNRTVAVHPAIMLEVLKVVYEADHLLEELDPR
jgi:V8-like Glu-specific endopeptidase